jgi:flagellar assembly protein FliH
MLLSSNVIKQVSSELEDCPVYARIGFKGEGYEKHSPLKLESLKREADLILINARSEAENLLQETNNRISIIEQETYERGYKKGEQDARHTAKRAQAEFHESTRKVLQQVEEIREKIYRDTENELVQLAVDIAEKLVCRQLDINPETVVDIAKAACMQAKDCKQVIIYVEPAQIENIKARQAEIASQLYTTKRLKIIADSNIKSGGCRIETEQGYIDATVATMLKQLETVIREKV